jgi:hypothetical protein
VSGGIETVRKRRRIALPLRLCATRWLARCGPYHMRIATLVSAAVGAVTAKSNLWAGGNNGVIV